MIDPSITKAFIYAPSTEVGTLETIDVQLPGVVTAYLPLSTLAVKGRLKPCSDHVSVGVPLNKSPAI